MRFSITKETMGISFQRWSFWVVGLMSWINTDRNNGHYKIENIPSPNPDINPNPCRFKVTKRSDYWKVIISLDSP